jgi:hypothetical protein
MTTCVGSASRSPHVCEVANGTPSVVDYVYLPIILPSPPLALGPALAEQWLLPTAKCRPVLGGSA